MDKIEEIVRIVCEIPNEKWEKDKDGNCGTTELNDKQVKVQYGVSGMFPSIVIDGIDICGKSNDKIWILYTSLCGYFYKDKAVKTESVIDSIYNSLISQRP